MVSRTPTISIQERKVRWVYGTVVASTNDTFPISDLQSVTIILGVKTVDGVQVSFSIAGNVVTLTTLGLTDETIAFLAWGATKP